MATNDFLPFATGGGANVESQGSYVVDGQRPIGNQPGIARSDFVNKTLRQAAWISSQLAQFLSDKTGDNVLDDGNATNAQNTLTKAFKKAPTVQKFLTGSGTYTTPANVLYIRVRAVGAGGGGGGGGNNTGGPAGVDGTAGTNTTFGTTLLVANGGGAGGGSNNGYGGAGGSASLGAATGLAFAGAYGCGNGWGQNTAMSPGGTGGSTPLGGAGGGSSGWVSSLGGTAVPNTGSGGGGGGAGVTLGGNNASGGGGGAGGFVDAVIYTPAATYSYAVGVKGTGGAATAGAGYFAGGDGADGLVIVEEFYQ